MILGLCITSWVKLGTYNFLGIAQHDIVHLVSIRDQGYIWEIYYFTDTTLVILGGKVIWIVMSIFSHILVSLTTVF